MVRGKKLTKRGSKLSSAEAKALLKRMRQASRELKKLAQTNPPAKLTAGQKADFKADTRRIQMVIAPLDQLIAKWEEELQTVGNDAQLASIDLQNAPEAAAGTSNHVEHHENTA